MIFRCKMCGGTLEIGENIGVATCQYCGTEQTLPKLDNERRCTLYDRASHFRRNNDFDKAMSIYEQILAEDGSDSEAYWSLVLCRYGIEYVEDPATKKRVPTVNRMQYTSIFDDEDYKSAIENASIGQKLLYEAEAKSINEIQKGILAISQKEAPFDIFICYKETDANGRRTPDSVLANELYHELTAEGFKVFFAKITLEDKLGIAYEPYIFAALNSAKAMVVLGTRADYFNAVWVKNEWSRYLALVKKSGGKKVLIPAYRDMDPYDLPDEFSHLQAQDMSKLGFMQDLIRGIRKIVKPAEAKAVVRETVTISQGNTDALLKRAQMALDDGEFERADEFCEQVLNQDPENVRAYLGKLLAELKFKKKEELSHCAVNFSENVNYQKIIRFCDESLRTELVSYLELVEHNLKEKNNKEKYLAATEELNKNTLESCREAAKIFSELVDYRDSAEKANEAEKRVDAFEAEIAKKAKFKKRITIISVASAVMAVLSVLLIIFVIAPAVTINGYKELYGEDIVISDKEEMPYFNIDEKGRLSFDETYVNVISGKVVIPDVFEMQVVKSLENGIFRDITTLEEVVLPVTITEIPSDAFKFCSALKEVIIPSNIEKIRVNAFDACENLKQIRIPEGVSEITYSVFLNCASLEYCFLPASIENIESNAFKNCALLTNIQFGGTMMEWESIQKELYWHKNSQLVLINCKDGDVTI